MKGFHRTRSPGEVFLQFCDGYDFFLVGSTLEHLWTELIVLTHHTKGNQQMATSNQVVKKCVAAIRHKHFWKSTTLSETVLKGRKRFSVKKRESSDQNWAKIKKSKKWRRRRKKGFFYKLAVWRGKPANCSFTFDDFFSFLSFSRIPSECSVVWF